MAPNTNNTIWSYPTGDAVYSSPAAAYGMVFVGSNDGNVYCLNASDGALVWSYTTGSIVMSSPAVADGKLFVGSTDGKVYAFKDIRDVAITNIAPSKTIVGQGRSVYIDVTVENQGNLTETLHVTAHYGNLTITPEQWDTFWSMGDVNEDGYINQTDSDLIAAHFGTSDPQYDINESGFVDINDLTICGFNQGLDIWTYFLIGDLIGKQTVHNLPPGDSTTITFTWDTAGVPYNNWTITATATTLPSETDTADNNRTCWVVVTILGDVNGDYVVDGSDLSDLNKAYGSTPGKPNWDPNCDLNDDNKIDASDLFELSENYGKTA